MPDPLPSRQRLLVDGALLSVTLVWGFNFAIMKSLYSWVHPLAFTFVRFITATATLWLILKLRRQPLGIERRDLVELTWLGILANTIYQIIFVTGLSWTRAGNAGLLMSSTPVFAYFAALVLRRETFRRRVLAGILLSMTGVVAVVLFGSKMVGFGATWRGDLLVLLSALCWGWYTGSAGRLAVRYGALRLTFWIMLTGTVFLIPALFPWAIAQDWSAIPARGWAAAAYSTFLSIVYAYLAWSFALEHLGGSHTAVYSNVTPLVALLGGWLLLGEVPTVGQFAGVALILGGVLLVRKQRVPGPTAR
jgi:drug/metabolite transporter (DMT)-like permease